MLESCFMEKDQSISMRERIHEGEEGMVEVLESQSWAHD